MIVLVCVLSYDFVCGGVCFDHHVQKLKLLLVNFRSTNAATKAFLAMQTLFPEGKKIRQERDLAVASGNPETKESVMGRT